jgi:hypothetical protein
MSGLVSEISAFVVSKNEAANMARHLSILA